MHGGENISYAMKEIQPAGGTTVTSEAILIPNPAGLHARPAAVLTNAAKKFSGPIDWGDSIEGLPCTLPRRAPKASTRR